MKTIIRICLAVAMMSAMACSTKKPSGPAVDGEPAEASSTQIIEKKSTMMPKAVIYRTNGDYADHVFVNENTSGTLVSYPDPKDITSRSTPVELGDGWLLDRRGGISTHSRFLAYTYKQYSELPRVPSREALKQSIIPGAAVTECIVTPVTVEEAIANPEIVKKYIP